MRAGKLKTKFIVNNRTNTENDLGEMIPTWTPAGNAYGEILISRSNEQTAGMAASWDNVTIRMRANRIIQKSCMLQMSDGTKYEINGITGDNREILVYASVLK